MFRFDLRQPALRRTARPDGWRGATLGALLIISACTNAGGDKVIGASTTSGGTVTGAVSISSFTAEPSTIVEGDESVLSWIVSDPNASLKITPISDQIAGISLVVSPVVTTTYTLTATTAASIAVETVTVVVTPVPLAPTTTVDDGLADEWVNAAGNLEGLSSECGNLSFIAALPDRDTIIASVALQGMWALQDGSQEWARLGAAGGATIRNRATSIVQDPTDTSTFWQSGAYSGGGVYRTNDNGATFQQLGDIAFVDLVSVDFTDPQRQTLVAGIHEQPTAYKSTNGGATWELISDTLPPGVGQAGYPMVIDATTFLLATSTGDASGIYRTTDAGDTWTQISTIGAVGRPLVVGDAIYWLLEGSQGVVKSIDGGLNWTLLARGPNSIDQRTLMLLPDGRIASLGDRSIIVSSDLGESWQRIGPRMPYSANGLTYSPARNAFYAWRFDCVFGQDNAVPADAIIRLDIATTEVTPP